MSDVGMKIRRYYQGIGYPSDMEEHDEYGDWVKYEDVKPLLERIKELERYYNQDVKKLLERIKELEKQLEFERSLQDWM